MYSTIGLVCYVRYIYSSVCNVDRADTVIFYFQIAIFLIIISDTEYAVIAIFI